MKIDAIKIKNFRGYKEEKKINFDALTLIVGKNDVGKSTILEAADIFFGNHKPDINDLNITCNKELDKIEISVEFSNFPSMIDIDAGATTSLSEEYLLNINGKLEIKKIFTAGATTQPKIYLNVNMPNNSDVLVVLKNTELKAKAKSLKINEEAYKASINNSVRKAIWKSIDKTSLIEKLIDINKEDGKKIYEKLELAFPIFTLFSVDRKNTDQDDEIQTPIKASIKELLKTMDAQLEPIKQKVLSELDKISQGTIKKLAEMNPEIAKTLKPIVEKPAWEKAFSINIDSDGVPLNKRGSGVKRLVLINFFRQEAERKRDINNKTNVFYAIEEPETSQHPDWQIKLFDAFNELTEQEGVQIAITSHHPELCGLVALDNVRFIEKIDDGLIIKEGDENNYREISNTLGVLPKLEGVKVIVGVEGPNDIEFLKNISNVFGLDGNDSKILWVPMGGGTLRDYVDKGYLDVLNLAQIFFFDKDSDQKYKDQVVELTTKKHWAKLTEMLTLENYIHPKYYINIWPDLTNDFIDTSSDTWLTDWKNKNILIDLSNFIKLEFEGGKSTLRNYGAESIKKSFAKIASKMTMDDFKQMGTYEELEKLFEEIKKNL